MLFWIYRSGERLRLDHFPNCASISADWWGGSERSMRIGIIVSYCALATAQTVLADDRSPAIDLDQLTEQPGVEISHRQVGDVAETVWSRNGVSVTRSVQGARTTIAADDNSGRGAVICSWSIEVSARASLEACPTSSFAELRQDLDRNIALIDAFIVANSLEPTTLEKLRRREEEAYSKARHLAQTGPAGSGKLCTGGYAGKLISYFNAMSREQRRKLVGDLLSVPRWAVLNPCM